jgi:hypothetical protein
MPLRPKAEHCRNGLEVQGAAGATGLISLRYPVGASLPDGCAPFAAFACLVPTLYASEQEA